MDADYANNKGSYVITTIKEHMTLTPDDLISRYPGVRTLW